MAPADPGRVLVVQTAFLGDVVLTTPLFRGLRRLYPRARLEALVTPEAAPLLEEDPHLDGLHTYAKRGGDTFGGMLARLRRGRYDLLVCPHRSPRTALLSLFSGVPRRAGFAGGAVPGAFTDTVRRPAEAHEVDRNLALLPAMGAAPEPGDRELFVGYGAAEGAAVGALLREAGVAADDQLVALCPGSVWATKRWLPEGFAAVGRALAGRGLRPVLLGAEGDREVAAEVARGIGGGVVNAVGRTSLKCLAAWMDRVRLLVTNDSAPLHVACARNTPVVAVFGATTRGLGFAPFTPRSRVVEVDLPCRPCGSHGGRRCPRKHFRCMRDVGPEAVAAAAVELLEEGGSG